jgi:hypothetical protein
VIKSYEASVSSFVRISSNSRLPPALLQLKNAISSHDCFYFTMLKGRPGLEKPMTYSRRDTTVYDFPLCTIKCVSIICKLTASSSISVLYNIQVRLTMYIHTLSSSRQLAGVHEICLHMRVSTFRGVECLLFQVCSIISAQSSRQSAGV